MKRGQAMDELRDATALLMAGIPRDDRTGPNAGELPAAAAAAVTAVANAIRHVPPAPPPPPTP